MIAHGGPGAGQDVTLLLKGETTVVGHLLVRLTHHIVRRDNTPPRLGQAGQRRVQCHSLLARLRARAWPAGGGSGPGLGELAPVSGVRLGRVLERGVWHEWPGTEPARPGTGQPVLPHAGITVPGTDVVSRKGWCSWTT